MKLERERKSRYQQADNALASAILACGTSWVYIVHAAERCDWHELLSEKEDESELLSVRHGISLNHFGRELMFSQGSYLLYLA